MAAVFVLAPPTLEEGTALIEKHGDNLEVVHCEFGDVIVKAVSRPIWKTWRDSQKNHDDEVSLAAQGCVWPPAPSPMAKPPIIGQEFNSMMGLQPACTGAICIAIANLSGGKIKAETSKFVPSSST